VYSMYMFFPGERIQSLHQVLKEFCDPS
jgi:hypothetical protein